MPGIIDGLRITECAAFIACPYATMSLAQLGAEVIRIDPLAGGLDYRRWPVTATGRSLYWAGLNKGKKSVRIDLRSEEGRELALALITAPGAGGGIFATNLPASGWLDSEGLIRRRSDMIVATIVGNRDGSTALDYTINCAAGLPGITGPEGDEGPINHVLPAWDLLTGLYLATAILAADRYRDGHGHGQRIQIALSDVAFAAVSNLGMLAELEINDRPRGRHGNHIYGAFGHDFATADGRRVMAAAVSIGQWRALVGATGIADWVESFEKASGTDLSREGDRFEARETILEWLTPWFAARTLDQVRSELDAQRACWGPYQDIEQMLAEDVRVSASSPLFEPVEHRAIGRMLTARTPLDFSAVEAIVPAGAPVLGADTDLVLSHVLGLDGSALGQLHDRGVVAGPDDA